MLLIFLLHDCVNIKAVMKELYSTNIFFLSLLMLFIFLKIHGILESDCFNFFVSVLRFLIGDRTQPRQKVIS